MTSRHRSGSGAPGARAVRRVLALCVAVAAAISTTSCASNGEPTRIAAASDLQFALSEVASQFTTDTGQRVEVVFGASGNLTRQIQDGAPFSMFLSADEGFVAQLHRAGRTRDAGTLYAIGRLALFAPPGSPLVPHDGLDGLARLVEAGKVTRFAIANPEHAPYGRAAEQALRKRGVWDDLRPALVLGENVSQAAQFAAAGDAVGGIIAHSLALAPAMRDRGTYALIPAEDHDPLRQRMVLLSGAGPVAERFYAYLQEPGARTILAKYGFALPD